MAAIAAISCMERHPDLFGDITGIYFYNRSAGSVVDGRSVTFAYEDMDEMMIPVTVQLLGRPSGSDRKVYITASSDNAVPDVDYRLPEKAVLPAGATSFEYTVTLLRTSSLTDNIKSLTLEVHANENFELPVTEIVQASGRVTALKYTITFSDMMNEPPAAWNPDLLGKFSRQKFELIFKVVPDNIKRSDFNDASKMTYPLQVFIFMEMRDYINEEVAKMEAGEPYDKDIIDQETGEPLSYEPEKKD